MALPARGTYPFALSSKTQAQCDAQIMPLSIRAKGVSLSTATNWAFNYVVGELTPVLQEAIQWRLYVMHGGFCVASFFLVLLCKFKWLNYLFSRGADDI